MSKEFRGIGFSRTETNVSVFEAGRSIDSRWKVVNAVPQTPAIKMISFAGDTIFMKANVLVALSFLPMRTLF